MTTNSIGVIGPEDLVSQMISMGDAYPEYRFLDLSYHNEKQTLEIFEQNRSLMGVCLFTGDWPYSKVIEEYNGDVDVEMVYAWDVGPALPKTLLKMVREGISLDCLSVDTVTPSEFEETFKSLGIYPKGHHLMESQTPPLQRESYIRFHRSLWESGATTGAITFLTSAYEQLKRSGMPIYRATSTVGALREAVARAVLRAHGIKMQLAQTAVGLVKPQTDVQNQNVGDNMYRGQIEKHTLHEALMKLGESRGIFVVPLEGLSFSLFLTRGALRDITDNYQSMPVISQITEACEASMFFGFGTGESVNISMANAQKALKAAREFGDPCAFVVQDDEIMGPLGHRESMRLRRSQLDRQVLNKIQQSNLGLSSVCRVEALLRRMGSSLLTSEQLAAGLSISRRSARRLLSRLNDAGFAQVVGLEQTHRRGRPQQIFQVTLDRHSIQASSVRTDTDDQQVMQITEEQFQNSEGV